MLFEVCYERNDGIQGAGIAAAWSRDADPPDFSACGVQSDGLQFRAANVDPALASSVFITTFTDVCGFASFLGLATLYTRYIRGAG